MILFITTAVKTSNVTMENYCSSVNVGVGYELITAMVKIRFILRDITTCKGKDVLCLMSMYSGKSQPTFRRNVLIPPSGSKIEQSKNQQEAGSKQRSAALNVIKCST
jgi:hypothetical protein